MSLARRIVRFARLHAGDIAGILLVLAVQAIAMRVFVKNGGAVGFLDWDVQLAYKYSGILSLTRFHEGPWWNPWLCGGHPNWGYPEGATSLVTPTLIYWLVFPAWWAIRLEAVTLIMASTLCTYLFASRYLVSPAARTLVTLLYAANSRWFLEIGVGHLWYLSYAVLPLSLWSFEKAIDSGRVAHAFGAAATLAFMVYTGGTYPVAHAALALVVLALVRCYSSRNGRPLLALAVAGTAGIALAAPKLLPVNLAFGRLGRPIDSTEIYGPAQLLGALTHRAKSVVDAPNIEIAFKENWWESGMFIGWGGVMVLLVGAFAARGREARAIGVLGWVFAVLSAGAFHALAPWTLLHRLPVFWSMHVPIRFLHVALLALAVAGCRTIESWALGAPRWASVAAMAAVGAIALDLSHANYPLWDPVFKLKPPSAEAPGTFTHVQHSRFQYIPPLIEDRELERCYEWPPAGMRSLGSMYLSIKANEGILDCYGMPAGPKSRVLAGRERPLFQLSGAGSTKLVSWSPARAVVAVSAAEPGARLVYNMNYDVGWRANGAPAHSEDGLVATRLDRADAEVTFAYTPPGLWPGLFAFFIAVVAGVLGRRRVLPLLPF